MGPHSVSCHPTQVNTPRLNPARQVDNLNPARQVDTWLTKPGGMEGWGDQDGWVRTEMVYPSADSHPSKVVTVPSVEQLRWLKPTCYHYTTWLPLTSMPPSAPMWCHGISSLLKHYKTNDTIRTKQQQVQCAAQLISYISDLPEIHGTILMCFWLSWWL